EVVGYATGQQTDRLHLLSFDKGILRLLEGFLLFPELGDVSRDLAKSDGLAVLVPDRMNDRTRPELAAVPADPPSLALESAVADCALENLLRQTCLAIILGKEAREMLP